MGANALVLALSASLLGAAAAEKKPKPVDAPVRITTDPPGALARICFEPEFSEASALPLGKTPLLRLQPLPESGAVVQVMKSGFQEWTGRVTPGAPELKVQLTPLTETQKQELGWFISPPASRLNVVPIRVGIKKSGSPGEAMESSKDAAGFTNRFLSALDSVLRRRFSAAATVTVPALSNDSFWQQLAGQLEGVSISTIGFTPAPRRLALDAGASRAIDDLGGLVLLVRAEARYLGGGSVFARTAVPLLLSAGTAAAGAYGAAATGASSYTYSVYGPLPSGDVILVQLFLVHSATRELQWYGQVALPQFYKRDGAAETAAAKAAEQVPAAFFTAGN